MEAGQVLFYALLGLFVALLLAGVIGHLLGYSDPTAPTSRQCTLFKISKPGVGVSSVYDLYESDDGKFHGTLEACLAYEQSCGIKGSLSTNESKNGNFRGTLDGCQAYEARCAGVDLDAPEDVECGTVTTSGLKSQATDSNDCFSPLPQPAPDNPTEAKRPMIARRSAPKITSQGTSDDSSVASFSSTSSKLSAKSLSSPSSASSSSTRRGAAVAVRRQSGSLLGSSLDRPAAPEENAKPAVSSAAGRGGRAAKSMATGAQFTSVKSKSLELSEEEKAMSGAPEGELFVVEVLASAELPPFTADDAPAAALAAATAALAPPGSAGTVAGAAGGGGGGGGVVAWNVVFDGVTALRRLVAAHAHAPVSCGAGRAAAGLDVALDAATVGTLVPGLVAAARDLRSVLVKNALAAVEDLFAATSTSADATSADEGDAGSAGDAGPPCLLARAEDVALLLGACVDCSASNQSKATRAAAAACLAQCAARGTDQEVLRAAALALARLAGHKNKDSGCAACVACERCLTSLTTADPAFAAARAPRGTGADERGAGLGKELLPSLLRGLGGKSPEGKKACRSCCALVAASLDRAAAAAAGGGAAGGGGARLAAPVGFRSTVGSLPGLSTSHRNELLVAAGVVGSGAAGKNGGGGGGGGGGSSKRLSSAPSLKSLMSQKKAAGPEPELLPELLPEPPPRINGGGVGAAGVTEETPA